MCLRVLGLLVCLAVALGLAITFNDPRNEPIGLVLFITGVGGLVAGRWWAPLVAYGAVTVFAIVTLIAVSAEGDRGEMPAFAAFLILLMYGFVVAACVGAGVLVRVVFDQWIGWVHRTREPA